MTKEQTDNLLKLETIADSLRVVLNLFQLGGYKASPEELKQIDEIAQRAATVQKWARM